MKQFKKAIIIIVSIITVIFTIALIRFATHSKFDGIFEIRLGMTETELNAMVDSSMLRSDDYVFRTLEKSKFLDGSLKGFYLRKYVVDDNYVIEGIQIALYNDRIYQIVLLNLDSKTESLLDEKFGKREIITYKRDVKGENRQIVTQKETKWHTYDFDVECTSTLYYHSNQPSIYNILEITNLEVSKEINMRNNNKSIEDRL